MRTIKLTHSFLSLIFGLAVTLQSGSASSKTSLMKKAGIGANIAEAAIKIFRDEGKTFALNNFKAEICANPGLRAKIVSALAEQLGGLSRTEEIVVRGLACSGYTTYKPLNAGQAPASRQDSSAGVTQPRVLKERSLKPLSRDYYGIPVLSIREFKATLRKALAGQVDSVDLYDDDLDRINQISQYCAKRMPLVHQAGVYTETQKPYYERLEVYGDELKRVCELSATTFAQGGGAVLEPFNKTAKPKDIYVTSGAYTNPIEGSGRSTFEIKVFIENENNRTNPYCLSGGPINPIVGTCSSLLVIAAIRP